MGRIMGLDFGSKTVGVALTDPLGLICSPTETITREREGKMRATFRRITDIASEKGVEEIAVGLPVNMDGSESERSRKSRQFAEDLRYRLMQKGLDIPIFMQDERLTTVSADEILADTGVKAADRKTYIDSVAASLILEDYIKNKTKKG